MLTKHCRGFEGRLEVLVGSRCFRVVLKYLIRFQGASWALRGLKSFRWELQGILRVFLGPFRSSEGFYGYFKSVSRDFQGRSGVF